MWVKCICSCEKKQGFKKEFSKGTTALHVYKEYGFTHSNRSLEGRDHFRFIINSATSTQQVVCLASTWLTLSSFNRSMHSNFRCSWRTCFSREHTTINTIAAMTSESSLPVAIYSSCWAKFSQIRLFSERSIFKWFKEIYHLFQKGLQSNENIWILRVSA